MKTQDFIQIENEHGAHNYHPLDVVVKYAEGCWVYDVEDKKYLDCLAAYSARIREFPPIAIKAFLDIICSSLIDRL